MCVRARGMDNWTLEERVVEAGERGGGERDYFSFLFSAQEEEETPPADEGGGGAQAEQAEKVDDGNVACGGAATPAHVVDVPRALGGVDIDTNEEEEEERVDDVRDVGGDAHLGQLVESRDGKLFYESCTRKSGKSLSRGTRSPSVG